MTAKGKRVSGPTGPVVWGEPGTNGQHAFFQLLHQGTDIVPVEFIVAAESFEPDLKHHHDMLLANCFAQSEALMKGRTLDEAREQLIAKGMSKKDADDLAPHKVFPGNRPTLTLVHKKLTPYAFGRLVALYEHRVFVEARFWHQRLRPMGRGARQGAGDGAAAGGSGQGGRRGRRDASTAGLVRHVQGLGK